MSVNRVLSKTKYACDMVKLKLSESYCMPLLLYGAESGFLDENMIKLLNSCWNSVYRKFFGYFRWESMRNIMYAMNKLNVVHLVNLRRILFVKKLLVNVSGNNSLMGILKKYIYNNEFQTVLNNYNIDFFSSEGKIKERFHSDFACTCQG